MADRHAGEQDGTRPDPNIRFHGDGKIILQRLSTKSRMDRVTCRGNDHLRPDHHAIAYNNVRIVHDGQSVVGIDIVTDVHMTAPVRIKRRLDPDVVADLRKHLV